MILFPFWLWLTFTEPELEALSAALTVKVPVRAHTEDDPPVLNTDLQLSIVTVVWFVAGLNTAVYVKVTSAPRPLL